MAFNPFHRFRKHQKAIYAVLAIICMFVFILQFGRGDAIERALHLIGYSRAKGEVVTTLYNKKIREGDLQLLTQQRREASEFLQILCEQAHIKGLSEANALINKGDDVQLTSLRNVSQLCFSLYLFGGPRNDALFKQVLQSAREAERMRELLEATKRTDQAKVAKALVSALEYQAWKRDPRLPADEFYFGGTPRNEDLLDFLVWKHQADKLGITLDEDSVLQMSNQEAGSEILESKKFADDPLVRTFLSSSRRSREVATVASLYEALRDEFRVALAQEALLGQAPGARAYHAYFQRTPSPQQVPATGTPDEFLQYYREQRTTLNVGLLPLSVQDFVGKVEAKPTESELVKLYERYKSQEPAPDRRDPGFKEPRRIRVEYLTTKPDAPLYRQLAARSLDMQEQLLRFAPPLTLPGGGGVAGWDASTAAPFLLPADVALYSEYETYRDRIRPWNDPFRITPSELHDSSIQQPDNAASTLGQLLGSAATGGSVLAAPATFVGTGTMAEVRDSLKFNLALLLAKTSPTPYTTAALVEPFSPRILPMETVKPQLRERLLTDLAPQIMAGNLDALVNEMNKLKGRPAEARALLEKLKDKDIHMDAKIAAMPENDLRTIYTIAEDPALKSFKEAYDAAQPFSPMQSKPDFAHRLFSTVGTYQAEYGVTPMRFAGGPDPYVFWRVEDKQAHERTFAEARADVEAAWLLQAARPLAVREAERIKQELLAKKLTLKDDIEKFLNDQKRGRPINLNNVARLVPIPSPLAGPTEYERYRPPASEVPYPPTTFVRQLLVGLVNPGDAVVIKDAPEKTIYVAVLLVPRDDRRNFKEFSELYERTPDSDTLWQNWFMEERRREFRRRVLEQLRAEAGTLDAEGRFVINETTRGRGEISEPAE